jgi:hypothetical protein
MSRLLAQIDIGDRTLIGGNTGVSSVYKTPADLINIIVPNLFILAGVIFLFLLILGGFAIISSGSAKSVEEGQKKVTTAIIGLLVMFSAYWIIQIVQLLTGVRILF